MELKRLGAPFISATDGGMIPVALSDVPIVKNPYDIAAVLTALEQARQA